MKIVVNKCWGGFGLSNKAIYEYHCRKYGKENIFAYKAKDWFWTKSTINEFLHQTDFGPSVYLFSKDLGETFNERELKENGKWYESFEEMCECSIEFRSDPILVEVVEKLGKEANGFCASLEIIDVPDDVKVYIDEYDGMEKVRECHRSW